MADFHAFLGLAPSYSGVGAARVGYKAYEVGLLSATGYGILKKFSVSKRIYASLGVGIFGAAAEPGIHTNFGFYLPLFSKIGFRAEVLAEGNTHGNVYGYGIIGLSLNFYDGK